MAPITSNVPLRFLGPQYSEVYNLSLDVYPISIWGGAPVIIDQSADDTAVVPADGVTMASGDVFVGIAAGHATSELGQTDPTELEVYVWPTIIGFPSTALDISDLGKNVSMSDSGTLTASGGAYPKIGSLYSVRDGYLYILLDPPTPK